MRKIVAVAVLSFFAGACASGMHTDLPLGQQAYAIIPASAPASAPKEYVLGPLDTISVDVFQEPDLSAKDVRLDSSGNVLLPLVGSVHAAGKTASQLSGELTGRLARYVVRPNVTVTADSITQKVTIEGEVNQPGVYDIKGNSSLLEALAMAHSPTEVAALDQVIVFRNVNGQRMGARFNLQRIRAGSDPDPLVIGGDRIVVGYSSVKGAWRDFLKFPIFNLFKVF
jgi:polysaccharide export outer membrane protein